MRTVILVLLAIVSGAAWAEVPTVKLIGRVGGGGPAMPLTLQTMEVDVRIHGPAAETLVTMVFANPHEHELVGEFEFPLPPDAVMTSYALDVGGRLREGVLVARELGRRAFDTLSGRRIDPGLLETSGREWFHTEVFPLPAKGSRTIRVGYTQERCGQSFRVPLNLHLTVPRFALTVEVADATGVSVREGAGLGLTLALRDGIWRGQLAPAARRLDADLELTIVRQDATRLIEAAADGWHYFASECPAPARPAVPSRVTLLWAASRACAARDHRREFEWLRALCQALPDGTPLELRLLRLPAEAPRAYAVKAGQCAALLTDLQGVIYDGAAWLEPARDLTQPGLTLVCGGETALLGPAPAPPSPGTVVAVLEHDAPAAWQAFLQAHRALPIVWGETTPAAAAAAALLAVSVAAAPDVELPADAARPHAPGELLVGRFRGPQATLRLTSGTGEPTTLTLAAADARPGHLLRRLWGLRRLRELLAATDPAPQALLAFGREFGIATPQTSFIVLESVAQYLDYGIPPPAAEPELLASYYAACLARRCRPFVRPLMNFVGTLPADRTSAARYQAPAPPPARWHQALNVAREARGEPLLPIPATTTSVARLAAMQNRDGSWGEGRDRARPSSLALLLFLENGETPLSERYGRTVQRAMRWLCDYMGSPLADDVDRTPGGALTHAVGSMALSESYGMTRIPFLRAATERGVERLCARQRPDGGFGPGRPDAAGPWDLELSAWSALALKSAYVAGVKEERVAEAMRLTIRFLRRTAFLEDAGAFSRDGTPVPCLPLTGAAVYALQTCGAGACAEARAGLATILKHRLPLLEAVANDPEQWPGSGDAQLPTWWWDHQAMFSAQSGTFGTWRTWRDLIEKATLTHQRSDGTWERRPRPATPVSISEQVEQTVLSALPMEVYYRYLPTFDRALIGRFPITDDTNATGADDERRAGPALAEARLFDIEPQDVAGPALAPGAAASVTTTGVPAQPAPAPAPPVPAATYLEPLVQAEPGARLNRYLELAKTYGHEPAFFVNCADFFHAHGESDLAARVLGNVLTPPGTRQDDTLLVAFRLAHYGSLEAAIALLTRHTRAKPNDAGAAVALAVALAARAEQHRGHGRSALAATDEAAALAALAHPARGEEFGDTDTLLLLNTLYQRFAVAGPLAFPLPAAYRGAMPADLCVFAFWSTQADLTLELLPPGQPAADAALANPRCERGWEGWGCLLEFKAQPGTYRVRLRLPAPPPGTAADPVEQVFARIEVIQFAGTPRATRRVYPVTATRPRVPGADVLVDVATVTFSP